ncbi:hypothetical protein AOQ84DRAFT_163130 [Glonium stellatum]|uniref:Uncharacterized protein n=1 Tax=Glonium stellatum TaxID=574774 RepID=A0A8E2JMM5_9PEZI|nr:hypothetical protein AOQ84DRAFT_163130 [Glonium stellatum]
MPDRSFLLSVMLRHPSLTPFHPAVVVGSAFITVVCSISLNRSSHARAFQAVTRRPRLRRCYSLTTRKKASSDKLGETSSWVGPELAAERSTLICIGCCARASVSPAGKASLIIGSSEQQNGEWSELDKLDEQGAAFDARAICRSLAWNLRCALL